MPRNASRSKDFYIFYGLNFFYYLFKLSLKFIGIGDFSLIKLDLENDENAGLKVI